MKKILAITGQIAIFLIGYQHLIKISHKLSLLEYKYAEKLSNNPFTEPSINIWEYIKIYFPIVIYLVIFIILNEIRKENKKG